MICVVGSINTDLVIEVERIPSPGETIAGKSIARYPGGKGANQAVAAARLGAQVVMFGKVGSDQFGDDLRVRLQETGLDVGNIERAEGPSGLAVISVAESGENAITIVPGANALVDRRYIDKHLDLLASCDILLLQLEIPPETIDYLLRELPSRRPRVILDPSPVQDISHLLLERIDLLTPNEHELRLLSGSSNIEAGSRLLISRGVKNVICTAGADGAYLTTPDACTHFLPLNVNPLDTTAAGDAFNGALAWAWQTRPLSEAIPYACAAGALATTKRGAQPSLPLLGEIETIMQQQVQRESTN